MASGHAGERQPGPFLALALLLLFLQGAAAPPSKRFDWRSFIYCMDTKASVLLTLDGACAAVFLYTNYRTMLKLNCPNCDLYFHCRGIYKVLRWCRNSWKTMAVIETINKCQDLSKSARTPAQRAEEAQARLDGKNRRNCDRLYLEKKNCSYSPSKGKCMILEKVPSTKKG